MSCSQAASHDNLESHVEGVLSSILNTKQAIINQDKTRDAEDFIFLTFWDFDGTILKGDCSEGLSENGKTVYKGLSQLAIENGYSSVYQPNQLNAFKTDYHHLEDTVGRWFVYPFLAQMMRGSSFDSVTQMAEQHFNKVLKDYYFSSSVHMFNTLESQNVINHVISASADIFVDSSASTLNIAKTRFNGIEVQIEDGNITEKLVYPVTWSHGKTEKLQAIVKATEANNPGKKVVVLASFGNSYNTDGPFMKYVAEQSLPAGKPISVMINGGAAPEGYQQLFLEVNQTNIVTE